MNYQDFGFGNQLSREESEERANRTRLHLIEIGVDGPEDEPREITCEFCLDNRNCEFAFDPYNTDGDCLAIKY